MPAIGSDNDSHMLCDSIRRSADICETFSFDHSVDIDTSKSRVIATLANMSLIPPDLLAKPGYSLHARDTSVGGMPGAMFR